MQLSITRKKNMNIKTNMNKLYKRAHFSPADGQRQRLANYKRADRKTGRHRALLLF